MAKWCDHFNQVFELVFEHSLTGMAILDKNGTFLRINPMGCEIWEYDEEELIGKTWKDITFSEDLEKSTYFLNSYDNKSSSFHFTLEKRYVTGKGRVIYCKLSTTALRNSSGEIEFFISQVFDLTKKKEAILNIHKGLELLQEYKNK